MLAGGMILSAPVVLPALAVQGLAQDAEDSATFRHMTDKVRAGEMAALRQCTIACNSMAADVVGPEERHGLRAEAARALIAAAGPAPQPQDVVPLVVAYDLVSEQETPAGRIAIDEAAVRKAYDLLRRPDFEPLARRSPWTPYGGFDSVVNSVYGKHLALRTRSLPSSETDAFFRRCAATVRSAYPSPYKPRASAICSTAYQATYAADPPGELRKIWIEADFTSMRGGSVRPRRPGMTRSG